MKFYTTKITWRYKEEVMTDYYLGKRIQLGRHVEGLKMWGASFHIKGSSTWRGVHHDEKQVWYRGWAYNVLKTNNQLFSETRLTVRTGSPIITLSNIDRERYYRNVEVLRVEHRGRVSYEKPEEIPEMIQGTTAPMSHPYKCPSERCGFGGDKTKDEIVRHLIEHQKAYDLLEHEYPDLTWRN
jgi:hypothetical protein